jgi:WD40 repeat protein
MQSELATESHERNTEEGHVSFLPPCFFPVIPRLTPHRFFLLVFSVPLCLCGSFLHHAAAGDGADGPPIRGLAFSSDGALLAAGAGETEDAGVVAIWELPSGKVRLVHREPKGIPSVAFAPDGKTLAIGTFGEHAKLIDVASGKVVTELAGHGKAARSVAFSPDGKVLAVGSYDKFINIWDMSARRVQQTLTGHEGWVYSVAFSRDGRSLASASADHTVRIWNLTDGTAITTYRSDSLARRAFFTRDAQAFASVGWDAKATIRDAKSGAVLAKVWGQNAFTCSPDATLWASDSGRLIRVFRLDLKPAADDNLTRFHKLISQWNDDSYSTREQASKEILSLGLSIAPELDKLVKETTSAEVRIRARHAREQLRSPQPMALLRGHGGDIEWLDFSPDGKTLASASRDGSVRLWSTATWQEAAVLRLPHSVSRP